MANEIRLTSFSIHLRSISEEHISISAPAAVLGLGHSATRWRPIPSWRDIRCIRRILAASCTRHLRQIRSCATLGVDEHLINLSPFLLLHAVVFFCSSSTPEPAYAFLPKKNQIESAQFADGRNVIHQPNFLNLTVENNPQQLAMEKWEQRE